MRLPLPSGIHDFSFFPDLARWLLGRDSSNCVFLLCCDPKCLFQAGVLLRALWQVCACSWLSAAGSRRVFSVLHRYPVPHHGHFH